MPSFSAFCALSGKLIVFINTRETLTTVMDSIALLCHTHHKLNMKRRELIKPELNPLFTRFCKEDNLKDMAEVKKAGRNTDAKIIQCYRQHIKPTSNIL